MQNVFAFENPSATFDGEMAALSILQNPLAALSGLDYPLPSLHLC